MPTHGSTRVCRMRDSCAPTRGTHENHVNNICKCMKIKKLYMHRESGPRRPSLDRGPGPHAKPRRKKQSPSGIAHQIVKATCVLHGHLAAAQAVFNIHPTRRLEKPACRHLHEAQIRVEKSHTFLSGRCFIWGVVTCRTKHDNGEQRNEEGQRHNEVHTAYMNE